MEGDWKGEVHCASCILQTSSASPFPSSIYLYPQLPAPARELPSRSSFWQKCLNFSLLWHSQHIQSLAYQLSPILIHSFIHFTGALPRHIPQSCPHILSITHLSSSSFTSSSTFLCTLLGLLFVFNCLFYLICPLCIPFLSSSTHQLLSQMP